MRIRKSGVKWPRNSLWRRSAEGNDTLNNDGPARHRFLRYTMTLAEHAKGIAFALEDARLEIADCPDGHMFGSPDVLLALAP